MVQKLEIPKIIHYCWFGGKPLTPLAKKCIASWKIFFPDYEIVEWNEQNFDVSQFEYTRDAYAAGKYAFVSDMARLFILSKYGGIYFDTDVEVIKPFGEILQNGGYLGIESFENGFRINPGLGFACGPQSQIINGIFDIYTKLKFDCSKMKECNIVSITTDFLLRKGCLSINEIQSVNDMYIYPKDFFNPCDMNTGKIQITENTRSVHRFSGSWVDKKSLIRGKIYRFLNRFFGKRVANFVRKRVGCR